MINPLQSRAAQSALLDDASSPSWMGPLAPWTRRVVVDNDERARRWFAMCVAVSLLLHLLLLLIPIAKQKLTPASASSAVQGPLTVHLTRPAPHPSTEPPPPPPPIPHPRVIATQRHTPGKPAFVVPAEPKTAPPTTVTPEPAPPEDDFAAHMNANRAARERAEQEAAAENAAAAAASNEPSVNQRIMNNIGRATGAAKGEGTGGVFEILKIGVREGEFRFNGWHPGSGAMPPQTIPVDAGEGGDVRMAIVKGVIEVIRKYKKGDFDFESHRLGRTVTMSARPADTAALETFLMNEFFGDDLAATRSRYQR